MARITSETAVSASGGDRYLLVLMASQRTREIIRSGRTVADNAQKNSPAVQALKEIEQGKYTRKDFFKTLDNRGKHNEHHTTQGKRHPEFDLGHDPRN